MFLADAEFWSRLFGIVMIDLALAGDNAVVIALAVRTLEPRAQFLGRVWGVAGAVGLRLLFIALVSVLLKIPLLQFAGGAVLVWIAIKLVRPAPHGDVALGDGGARAGSSLGEAIKLIVIADVSMSLDNVLAIAAAAHGDLALVAFGLALSIPLVVWGSSLLTTLMTRFVWIIWLGGGILGFVAGEMLFRDPTVANWLGAGAAPLQRLAPWALGVSITLLAWFWWSRRHIELHGSR